MYSYKLEIPNRDLKVPHRLDVADMSTIQEAPFAAGRPFVMLLHGYTGHRDFSPNTEIRPGNILYRV